MVPTPNDTKPHRTGSGRVPRARHIATLTECVIPTRCPNIADVAARCLDGGRFSSAAEHNRNVARPVHLPAGPDESRHFTGRFDDSAVSGDQVSTSNSSRITRDMGMVAVGDGNRPICT